MQSNGWLVGWFVGCLGSYSCIVPLMCLELHSVCDILKLLMTTLTPHAFCPVDYSILAL